MKRIPTLTNGVLKVPAPAGSTALTVGSPAWATWLADDAVRSFSFQSPDGSYTARKERRQRGGTYWVAYRTAAGRQHKTYLGKAEELTPRRLAEVATALARTVAADDGTRHVSDPSGASTNRGGDLLLLATKLFAPRPRPDLVARPRLLSRLDAGLEGGSCTLLSAPAGSGKTTLLASWLARLDRPVGWLALDERDQDPHQVLRYLIAALQSAVPTCGRAALARLDSPPLPSPEVVLTSLINDLSTVREPCLLALDDYHLVRAPAVHSIVQFLVDHLPPAVHLVLSTREDPPLPLARMRASGQFAELRGGDLRFTPDEAASFLTGVLGLSLSNDDVATLVERTEGWAAGLQLAGLVLRDRADPAAFVAAFARGHRLVADYLSTEVLTQQPASIQRFLLTTSVLDRLCAPLCDAMLAADDGAADSSSSATGGSQEVLEALERANLFLIPMDDEQRWYRYHHLFADALRARLAREAGAAGSAAFHRRASAWFGREGLLPEAIQHALAGGVMEDAAAWIERLSPSVLANTSIRQPLATWLAALPESVVRTRPQLCLAHAWLAIHRYPQGPTSAWLDAAEQALPGEPAERRKRERGGIAATRALLATAGPTPELHQAQAWAEQALEDLGPEDAGFRSVAGVTMGKIALTQGRLEQAAQAFADAASAGQAAGIAHISLVARSQQVAIERITGTRRRAVASAQAALAWANDGGRAPGPGVGIMSVLLADLLRDGNELSPALPLATEGVRALRNYAEAPPLVLLASLSLTWLHVARGDAGAAADVLADARPLVEDGPGAALAPLLEAAEAQVRLALGDEASATAWAVAEQPIPLREIVGVGGHMFAAGLEAMGVAAARILTLQGRASRDADLLREAERRLETAWQLAEEQGLDWLRVRVLIIRALIADGLGDREGACASLAAAVARAEPEGHIRPFLDEGEPIATLLAAVLAPERVAGDQTGVSAGYFAELVAISQRLPPAPARDGALVEPPSEREIQVLRLLADGRSNTEIARHLVVERSTVKTHLIHLYGKLGVHSRTQAVARARALQLLD
jgi:LuxR family transcriptional regulator, maltose regulon positive regulatory protein